MKALVRFVGYLIALIPVATIFLMTAYKDGIAGAAIVLGLALLGMACIFFGLWLTEKAER